MINFIIWFWSCLFPRCCWTLRAFYLVSLGEDMSGDKPETVERVLDFSPKKKAGEWDRAGGGGPVARLEGR